MACAFLMEGLFPAFKYGKQRYKEVMSPAQGGFVVMSESGCGPGILSLLQLVLQGHILEVHR